jgi:hypothetical protein
MHDPNWEDDHSDYIEQIGALDDYISDVVYEDEDFVALQESLQKQCDYEDDDQRLGGNDNPYPED